ncbi:MAG: hypothetical protein ACKOWJ_00945 [Micrococcales bacterium]
MSKHRNKHEVEYRRPRHPRFSELDHCSQDRRKIRYRDKKMALNFLHHFENKAASDLATKGSTNRHECRVYACGACKGWHTTSRSDWALSA